MWKEIVQGVILLSIAIINHVWGKKQKQYTREQLLMMGAELAFKSIEAFKMNEKLTGEQAFNAFLGALNAWLAAGKHSAISRNEKTMLLEWSKMRSGAETHNLYLNGHTPPKGISP